MTSMIERVAKAVYDAEDPTSGDFVAEALLHSPYVGDGGRDYKKDLMEICRSAARAAIEAMRVPTDAMTEAGEDSEKVGFAADGALAELVWKVMIDAALNEDGKG